MTDHPEDAEQGEPDIQEPPPWLRASSADLQDLDFESPLAGATVADSAELGDLFGAAIKEAQKPDEPVDTAATRVFTMLSAVCGMHFKPQDRNEPFTAMIAWADGRRSAIPTDFREHVDLLADMADRATNTVLKARLSDVCWLLDRKRGKLANAAIAAYVEIIQKAARGELTYRFETEVGVFSHQSRDLLLRALVIARVVG